jgi:hypothetical protein
VAFSPTSPPTASLADELIADRRGEVRIEEQAEIERYGEG